MIKKTTLAGLILLILVNLGLGIFSITSSSKLSELHTVEKVEALLNHVSNEEQGLKFKQYKKFLKKELEREKEIKSYGDSIRKAFLSMGIIFIGLGIVAMVVLFDLRKHCKEKIN